MLFSVITFYDKIGMNTKMITGVLILIWLNMFMLYASPHFFFQKKTCRISVINLYLKAE